MPLDVEPNARPAEKWKLDDLGDAAPTIRGCDNSCIELTTLDDFLLLCLLLDFLLVCGVEDDDESILSMT